MSVISLHKTPAPTYRLPCWSQLEALFGEWWQRIISRYELEKSQRAGLSRHGDDSYRCLQRDPEAFLAGLTAKAFWTFSRSD